MKIDSLQLINFHGFEDKIIQFSDKFTVLIGDNGSGKTAILDGISVALGGFLSGFDGVNAARNIHDDEVLLKKFIYGSSISIEQQFPVKVSCKAEIEGKSFTWTRSLNGKGGKTTRIEAKQITKYSVAIQKKVREGKEISLPVLSYFGTGRLWAQKREKTNDPFKTGSRLMGYTNCLEPISNEKLFLRWFKQMTFISLQKGIEPNELKAVRCAMESCLQSLAGEDTIEKIRVIYDIESDELQITLDDERTLPFRLLSDGYRNVIGMVADIAFRMAVLNPHLENNVISETPGVVLIDELDLHLHPKWQRHVVGDLKRTFPKVQFIATTHSPFIIQSLEEGELRVLDIITEGEYADKSIEDIVENVMGIDIVQWSERKRKMYEAANRYFEALNNAKQNGEELKALKDKLDDLSKPFANNVAFSAFLEQERLLAEKQINDKKKEKEKENETS